MNDQSTHSLLMVEPVDFSFNEETAVNNFFQQKTDLPANRIQKLALEEFSDAVRKIQSKGIDIITYKSMPDTPDAIFPNNWITLHPDGTVVFYPMFAPNRRKERRKNILEILNKHGFLVRRLIDYSCMEKRGIFLEGSGSIVFDRINRIAYAAISERTNQEIFRQFCNDFNYRPVIFHATQPVGNRRLPIYHTNVLMSIADQYVLICMEAIENKNEKMLIGKLIEETGRELFLISLKQMQCFACNCLQVVNNLNEKIIILSETAWHSLELEQKEKLSSLNEILTVSIPTIEKVGGGGIRCMIAENFLPKLISSAKI